MKGALFATSLLAVGDDRRRGGRPAGAAEPKFYFQIKEVTAGPGRRRRASRPRPPTR